MTWLAMTGIRSRRLSPASVIAKRAIEETRWYMKRARNTLYKQHEYDLPSSEPADSLTRAVLGLPIKVFENAFKCGKSPECEISLPPRRIIDISDRLETALPAALSQGQGPRREDCRSWSGATIVNSPVEGPSLSPPLKVQDQNFSDFENPYEFEYAEEEPILALSNLEEADESISPGTQSPSIEDDQKSLAVINDMQEEYIADAELSTATQATQQQLADIADIAVENTSVGRDMTGTTGNPDNFENDLGSTDIRHNSELGLDDHDGILASQIIRKYDRQLSPNLINILRANPNEGNAALLHVEALQEEVQNLRAQLDGRVKFNSDVHRLFPKLATYVKNLLSELDSLESEVERLHPYYDMYYEVFQDFHRLQQEQDRQRRRLDTITNKNFGLNDQNVALIQENYRLKAEMDRLQKANGELKQSLASVQHKDMYANSQYAMTHNTAFWTMDEMAQGLETREPKQPSNQRILSESNFGSQSSTTTQHQPQASVSRAKPRKACFPQFRTQEDLKAAERRPASGADAASNDPSSAKGPLETKTSSTFSLDAGFSTETVGAEQAVPSLPAGLEEMDVKIKEREQVEGEKFGEKKPEEEKDSKNNTSTAQPVKITFDLQEILSAPISKKNARAAKKEKMKGSKSSRK